MPFMANGSLLAYIRMEKTSIVVPKEAGDDLASSLVPRPPLQRVLANIAQYMLLLLWIPLKN